MTDKKATIVIVDDDPRLLTTLSINFKARGYEVYCRWSPSTSPTW